MMSPKNTSTQKMVYDRAAAQLFDSCEGGYVHEVSHLLHVEKVDPNICNADNDTPLFPAIRGGRSEVVESLLAAGADPNWIGSDSWTPLLLAYKKNSVEIAKLLLEHGANADFADNDGWTLLHYSSNSGYLEFTELLLEFNADPDLTDKRGWSPVHLASNNGHGKIVKTLLKVGVNIDLVNIDGLSPLRLACESNLLVLVSLLLEAGANPNSSDKNGWSPLHVAASNGNFQIVCKLLDHEADQKLRTLNGEIAWDLAIKNGHKQDLGLLDPTVDKAGPSYRNDITGVAAKISRLESEIESATYSSEQQAITSNRVEIKVPNIKDYQLLESVKENNLKQLRNLIDLGANVNAKGEDGQGSLHLAILNKNMNIFHFLLHQRINVNIENDCKRGIHCKQTPIHMAIINDQFDMFFLLLEVGANPNVKDSHSHTPYFFANKLNNADVMQHLLAYGAHEPNIRVFATPPPAAGTRFCDICTTDPVNCFSVECGHVYCERCIRSWMEVRPDCPMCKDKIKTLRPLYY